MPLSPNAVAFFIMETKVCTKCYEEKLLEEFYKLKKGKFGRTSICKRCTGDYHKKWRSENKEHSQEYFRNYYLENQEEIKETSSKYYQANREQVHAKTKEKYHSDELFKFSHGLRALVCSSFRRACDGKFSKRKSTEVILGCTVEEFVKHISAQFREGMSLDNYGEWHLDHIKPLALAETEKDILEFNHYTNFQPLWAEENISKGAKNN